MKRVGIFGGSFNPIHIGHLSIAHSILNARLVDEIWMMLSPQNPLKPKPELLDEQIRWELLQRALNSEKQIIASNVEFHLSRPSYTYLTLRELRKQHPTIRFSIIIGEDNWDNFYLWKGQTELLQYHNFIIYPRQQNAKQTLLKKDYTKTASPRGQIYWVKAPFFPLSSTLIRQRIALDQDITDFVPAEILNDCLYYYRDKKC